MGAITSLPAAQTTVVFMEQAVEFEWLRGNLFRITDPNTGVIRIVEAKVLADSIANAARCYREYRTAECAIIIPFPEPVEAAH